MTDDNIKKDRDNNVIERKVKERSEYVKNNRSENRINKKRSYNSKSMAVDENAEELVINMTNENGGTIGEKKAMPRRRVKTEPENVLDAKEKSTKRADSIETKRRGAGSLNKTEMRKRERGAFVRRC